MAAHVNELLRLVVRAFHGPECGVVLDSLLRANRCIKDDEMAVSLKLQQKQVRKYLFELRQDHIVAYENRNKEALNKGERSTAHLHWFIDYKHAVDCIKFRLHQIAKKFNEEKDREMQVQMYECKQCRHRYNALDAAMLSMTGWRCDRCIGEVEEVEASASASHTVNLVKTMWSQLKPITEAMKRVEAHPIPKFPKTAAGAVLAGMEDESMLISTRSTSGSSVGGSGLGPAPSSSSSSSRGGLSSVSTVNGGQVNVFVDIVGAQNGTITGSNSSQSHPKTPAKPIVPWLQNSSSTAASTSSNNLSTQNTNNNTSTTSTEYEMDPEIYEQYVKQYMEEQQKQRQLLAGTKHKANGGVKDEPDGTEVAQPEKKRRVEEEAIKVEIEREDIKQELEPAIEFENEPVAHEDPLVTIGDQQIPLTQVTDEHQSQMSGAEYESYYKLYMEYYAEHQ